MLSLCFPLVRLLFPPLHLLFPHLSGLSLESSSFGKPSLLPKGQVRSLLCASTVLYTYTVIKSVHEMFFSKHLSVYSKAGILFVLIHCQSPRSDTVLANGKFLINIQWQGFNCIVRITILWNQATACFHYPLAARDLPEAPL